MTNRKTFKEIFDVIATRSNVEYILKNMILPNPDKVIAQQPEGIAALRNLLYDPHVASCIQSRKSGVLSLKWEINRDGTPTPYTEFINQIFQELPLKDIISEMLEYCYYGYKVLEVLWLPIDGYIKPSAIIGKPSNWFVFDDLNLLRLRTKDNWQGEQIQTMYKFLVLRHNATYDNPYGEAILSKCFTSAFIKKEITQFWATFAEKYGMPYLHGKLELAALEETQEFADELDSLRQDGIVITGTDKEISILDASKSSSSDIYVGLINYCNGEISKAILSQTLSTEQSPQGGSNALGQTHLQVRQDVIDADKGQVEMWLNKLIQWIIEINFGAVTDIPKFEFYSELDVDMNLAQRDAAIAGTGQVKFSKEYWMRAYGFKEDEIEIVVQQAAAPFAELESENVKPVNPVAEQKDATEKLSVVGLTDFEKESSALLSPIVQMVQNGESLEQMEKALVALFPDLDASGIEIKLADSFVIANAGATIK